MGGNGMSEKCSCDILVSKNNSSENNSVCQQLSVVDEAKTDMEYKCFYNKA